MYCENPHMHILLVVSPRGGYEGKCSPPTFCHDGARDSFEIDEKIGGGGAVANLLKIKGRGQIFSFMSPLL